MRGYGVIVGGRQVATFKDGEPSDVVERIIAWAMEKYGYASNIPDISIVTI